MQFPTQVVKVLMSEATPSVSQEIVAKTNSNLRPWYDLWDYKLLSILHRKENKNQDMYTVGILCLLRLHFAHSHSVK